MNKELVEIYMEVQELKISLDNISKNIRIQLNKKYVAEDNDLKTYKVPLTTVLKVVGANMKISEEKMKSVKKKDHYVLGRQIISYVGYLMGYKDREIGEVINRNRSQICRSRRQCIDGLNLGDEKTLHYYNKTIEKIKEE